MEKGSAAESKVLRLVASLDSDDFDARERTTADLKKMGAAAEFPVRRLLETDLAAETRKRLAEVLSAVQTPERPSVAKGPPQGNGPLPPTDRAEKSLPLASIELRAYEQAFAVLAEVPTPEVREVLRKLADGEARGWFTRQAKICLARLSKQTDAP